MAARYVELACHHFRSTFEVLWKFIFIPGSLHAFFGNCADDITGPEATIYFYNNIIGMNTLGEDLLPTRIVWKNVGCSLIVWFCVFLCVAFGVEVTGKITYVTMGLPIVMLLVFLVRSVTLQGSKNGIDQYIGNSNYDILTEQPGKAYHSFSLPACNGSIQALIQNLVFNRLQW